MKTRLHLGLAALLTLAAAAVVAQTTTGRLIGTVVDDQGSALPGVTVTIASPALIGGAQTKITDAAGEAIFLSIAPGEYTVKAELSGHVAQERRQVKVPLGGAAAVHIAMPVASFSGEIEVLAVTPVVDPTQVNAGQVFDQAYMQDSAIGSDNRSYSTVVNQTAGVAPLGRWAGVAQPRVYGSTIGENAYFIDGMDATNPVMGTATAVVNFDAIDEIQLQTGGFEAEHGRATGGIINLVSKSGGNSFSGSVDARYRDDSFQESGDHFDADELSTRHQIYGATLGGPILRDTVWFFASYEWIDDVFTPTESPTTRDQDGENYLGKITWQIGPGWRLSGKYTTDPTTWDNINASRWRMAEATAFKKGQTAVLSAQLTSVLTDSLLWSTTLGRYDYESNVYPQSGDLVAIGHYNLDTGLSTVNYGTQQYWDAARTDFTTDLTWFVNDLAGSHELKGGIEYSKLDMNGELCSTGTPNGERCMPDVAGFFFYDIDVGGAVPFIMEEAYTPGRGSNRGDFSTVFAQDAWRPSSSVTLKLGLRYDTIAYETGDGDKMADMDKAQPRLGLAWDLTGDARNILRGHWGRFMHPNMLTLPSSVETVGDLGAASYYWYSCSAFVPFVLGVPVSSPDECMAFAADAGWDYRTDNAGWDPWGWVLSPDERYAGQPDRSDPNLRATYVDELILAFERELGSRSSIELTLVDKKTRDIVNDTCNGNWPTPSPDAACDYYYVANFPELKRDYRGVTLRLESRRLSWLTLLASYTYSSSRGSLDYSQNYNWELDLYPWHYDNIYGYLWDHQRHRVKLNGFLILKGDWGVAFDARWSSPFTWTPVEDAGDNPEIAWGYHYLEPRGSREANSEYQLDLQISKGFSAGPVRVALIATVLNALSTERPDLVCDEISGCGLNEDGSPINMGDPTSWQVPRRYEVGFRVEF